MTTAVDSFVPVKGDDLGVLTTEHTRKVQWPGPGKIVFSYSNRGKAINAHFASDKKGLRHVKAAIEGFCRWIFAGYPDCPMIFAMIKRPSVERIVKKCGFYYIMKEQDLSIYARPRHGRNS